MSKSRAAEGIAAIECINPALQKWLVRFNITPCEDGGVEFDFYEFIGHEPTQAEIVRVVKDYKLAQIEGYDGSEAVNQFFIGNEALWLDKATRTGLMLRINAEKAAGKTSTTLWYGTKAYTLDIDVAIQMLYAIEVYASDCYDCTAQHKLNVQNLTDQAEIEVYDFTAGYPEKLSFEEATE